ncbi:hypothetical protein Tco_0260036 [Tanacetum coccineum]
MDDPNITMEEYIRLQEEKALSHGKTFNWQTATYGKREYYDNEDDRFTNFKTEFPAIVFDDITSNTTLSCEPTVSPLKDNEIDFRISFDESDDEDYTAILDAATLKVVFFNFTASYFQTFSVIVFYAATLGQYVNQIISVSVYFSSTSSYAIHSGVVDSSYGVYHTITTINGFDVLTCSVLLSAVNPLATRNGKFNAWIDNNDIYFCIAPPSKSLSLLISNLSLLAHFITSLLPNTSDMNGYLNKRTKKHNQKEDKNRTLGWEKSVETKPNQRRSYRRAMAGHSTMAQMLHAPTRGLRGRILIPEIVAYNFELKHGLFNIVLYIDKFSRWKLFGLKCLANVYNNREQVHSSSKIGAFRQLLPRHHVQASAPAQAPAHVKLLS